MLEILTGTGLAVAAGLNAYIPLLLLGLAARFLDVVALPSGWAWLENEWVLGGLAVLLVIEVVADKVPVVDTAFRTNITANAPLEASSEESEVARALKKSSRTRTPSCSGSGSFRTSSRAPPTSSVSCTKRIAEIVSCHCAGVRPTSWSLIDQKSSAEQ